MLKIRQADEADASTVAEMIVEAFSMYRESLNPPPSALLETATTILEKLKIERCIVAEIGGVTVGCVMCKPENAGVYLGRLAVRPTYRRRGIAQALIAAVEAEARRLGANTVSLGVRVPLVDNYRLFAD